MLVPMMHLHLCRRVLLLVLLLILRGMAILLVVTLRLLRRMLGVRRIGVAVLLVVPWIHYYYVSVGEVRPPNIVLCHDIVSVCGVVKAKVQSRDTELAGAIATRAVTC